MTTPSPTPSGEAPLCLFKNVSKWYGPVIGLNDVTLDIQPGITGLVGHNGAGKSTLIRLLTGLLRPSLGEVRVRGRRAWNASAKQFVGYCPDVDSFYEEMSGRAFVRMMARFHGFGRQAAKDRAEEVLAQVAMTEQAHRRLGGYSKGMRQRIKLAQALVHDPELIVLDEPLNGVDPVGRLQMGKLFRDLAAQGKSILISSHILDEIDALADRILFIFRSRLMAAGTRDDVRAMLSEYPQQIRVTAPNARSLAVRLMALESVKSVDLQEDDLTIEVAHPATFFASLSDIVLSENLDLERLQVLDASTEAVFEYLMRAANRPR